jgi:microcystin-dependent protein
MPQPFVGEIRMFAGNFAPAGWALCNGQTIPISENDTLFNLIGTTYGGDGQTTFALPDLQCRIPMHQGGGFALATKAGAETVTLTVNQMTAHAHSFFASTSVANSPNPGGSLVAKSPQVTAFINANPTIPMAGVFLNNSGGNQAHSNMQPYLCVTFIISLFGIFPSQS